MPRCQVHPNYIAGLPQWPLIDPRKAHILHLSQAGGLCHHICQKGFHTVPTSSCHYLLIQNITGGHLIGEAQVIHVRPSYKGCWEGEFENLSVRKDNFFFCILTVVTFHKMQISKVYTSGDFSPV